MRRVDLTILTMAKSQRQAAIQKEGRIELALQGVIAVNSELECVNSAGNSYEGHSDQ